MEKSGMHGDRLRRAGARSIWWMLAVLVLLFGTALRAQTNAEFPSKPITLIVPYPPGGAFDAVLRALSNAAAQELGQPIVILNRPGAGGVTGTASLVTMRSADGYTLALMHNSVLRQPRLANVSWDPIEDFTYVIGLAGLNTGITVAATAPWTTLPALLEDARSRPGKISWGNVGAVTSNRIYAERLQRAADVRFNMVPFKGGSEAFTMLLGGHLDVYGDPGFGPMASSGKARLLATMTHQRLARWPDTPTLKELGFDLVVESIFGLVAPRGLPPTTGERPHRAFARATTDPVYRRTLDDFDMTPAVMNAQAFKQYARKQMAQENVLLDEIGFKPE